MTVHCSSYGDYFDSIWKAEGGRKGNTVFVFKSDIEEGRFTGSHCYIK